MAKGLNKVQLIGRLGATPEMRYTPQGNAVTTFRIAVDRVWKDTSGTKQAETDWFRIVVWNTLAENCNQFLDAGRLVYVEGRLQIRKWQDQNGQPRSTTEVIAQDVIFLDGRRDANGSEDDGDAEDAEATTPAARQPRTAPSKAGASRAANSKASAGRPPTTPPVRASGRANGSFDEEDLPF